MRVKKSKTVYHKRTLSLNRHYFYRGRPVSSVNVPHSYRRRYIVRGMSHIGDPFFVQTRIQIREVFFLCVCFLSRLSVSLQRGRCHLRKSLKGPVLQKIRFLAFFSLHDIHVDPNSFFSSRTLFIDTPQPPNASKTALVGDFLNPNHLYAFCVHLAHSHLHAYGSSYPGHKS